MWDASADALPGATEDASPEPQHRPDGDAEKLAVLAPDVLAPDAQSLPPERSARRAWPAPGTPDEVLYAEQSCAETAFADAAGKLEPPVSLPLELVAVAVQLAEPLQKSESQLGLQEASQPADSPDVLEPASPAV